LFLALIPFSENFCSSKWLRNQPGYDYYRQYSFDAIDLNRRIKAANSTEEIQAILQEIQPMPRAETRRIIKANAETLIEAQDDLGKSNAKSQQAF
jgi:hypothetical protein